MPAAAGVVGRVGRGRLPAAGPLAARRRASTAPALAHVLSGTRSRRGAQRLEKLHQRMADDDPSRAQRAPVQRSRRRVPPRSAGTPPSPRSGASPPVSGSAPDRLDLPITALSGGERRRVELARILFAGSDLLLLDEPTNHLDIDAKQWLMQFLRSYRGALLVISHDLELLDQAITRVLHLDEGELIEYRGTYSQYLAPREGRRGAPHQARGAAGRSEIHRLSALADSMRGQTEKRARIAKTLDHRVEKLARQPGHRGQAPSASCRVRLPDPPRGGRDRARGRGPREGVRPQDGVRGRDVRRRARRADAHARPQRRGQDHAAARRSSASSKPTSGRSPSATRCRSATTRRSTRRS